MADEDTQTGSVMGAKAEGDTGGEAPVGEGGEARQPAAVALQLDDQDIPALYANLCRVSNRAEEIILDLALDPTPLGGGTPQALKVSQRVIMNHHTAKRLAMLLMATVQQHEQLFGVLEVDIRKRVKAQPQQQG